jgi:Luciferase-like monooxygenase
MHAEFPITPDTGVARVGRRDMLKSAGVLLAASTTGLGAASAASQGGATAAPGPAAANAPAAALHKGMVAFMLAHEQFPVPELVRLGAAAEQAGFDMLATSDHFQPWQANERHAGEAWVTLGALGQQTHRVWMGPTVTCPTIRYNIPDPAQIER